MATRTRQTYDGYGLTEMRRMAREYKIPGRSKMDGLELLLALRAYWTARRVEQEQAVLPAATVGAVLRHKGTGTLVRVVEAVKPSENPHHDGGLVFRAEYIEVKGSDLVGGWADRGVERAKYYNEENRYAEENGYEGHWMHMLWQYEAVEASATVAA